MQNNEWKKEKLVLLNLHISFISYINCKRICLLRKTTLQNDHAIFDSETKEKLKTRKGTKRGKTTGRGQQQPKTK